MSFILHVNCLTTIVYHVLRSAVLLFTAPLFCNISPISHHNFTQIHWSLWDIVQIVFSYISIKDLLASFSIVVFTGCFFILCVLSHPHTDSLTCGVFFHRFFPQSFIVISFNLPPNLAGAWAGFIALVWWRWWTCCMIIWGGGTFGVLADMNGWLLFKTPYSSSFSILRGQICRWMLAGPCLSLEICSVHCENTAIAHH